MKNLDKYRKESVLKTLEKSSLCLLSVVIPTKNRPILLERALKSIESQEFKNIEVLVVNDGSSVAYESVISKFKWVRYFKLETSKGVSYARNYAINKADGEWILFP